MSAPLRRKYEWVRIEHCRNRSPGGPPPTPNTDVQNIDLMILADFCRNCLSKWYKAAADSAGLEVSMDEARERIYGMPYDEWKNRYQKEATPEQLAAFEARRGSKGTVKLTNTGQI